MKKIEGDSFSRRYDLDYRALPLEDADIIQSDAKFFGGRAFQLKEGKVAIEFSPGNVSFYDSRVACSVWLRAAIVERLEAEREALSISRKETEQIRPKEEDIKESNRTINIRRGEKMNLPKRLRLIGGLTFLGGCSMWILSLGNNWREVEPWSAGALVLGVMIFVYGLVTSRWGDRQ